MSGRVDGQRMDTHIRGAEVKGMDLLSRRQTLRIGCGAGAALGFGLLATPLAARPELDEIVAAFTGGRAPEASGVTLELPVLADNANAVPVGVRLDAPMTEEAFCEELVILAEANPRPLAATFRFTPRIGLADVGTRLRLTETQHVRVLARMSDGRILGDRREVTITGGGCGL